MPRYKITTALEAQILTKDGHWRPVYGAVEADTELGTVTVARSFGNTEETGQVRVVDTVTGEVNPGSGAPPATAATTSEADPLPLLAADDVQPVDPAKD